MNRITLCLALLLAGFVACGKDEEATPEPTAALEPAYDDQGREIDPFSGLVKAEDWELVAGNCVTCHSSKQFLRQRGTRSTWQYIIDWMQETQGLWQFPEGVEERIVTYLATNYAPTGSYRRAPIPATLMPSNPYVSDIQEQVDELRARGELPAGPEKKD